MAVTRLVNGHTNGASEIEFKSGKFLITDTPTEGTMEMFIEELNKRKVKEVVRVCVPTYETDQLHKNGIHVVDWLFQDGREPPQAVLNNWLNLIRKSIDESPDSFIAVHCVFGLGRAPLLVAIALMELGMKYGEAVHLIRMKRRGALNEKQLKFLEHYKPRSRLKRSRSLQQQESRSDGGQTCSIM